MPRLASALALAAVLGAGCGGPRGPVVVSWRFVDGRSCAGAGVSQVALSGPVSCTCDGGACAAGCRFGCEAGLGALTDGGAASSARVDLTGSGVLRADGLTSIGASIYRGDADIERLEDVQLELYFTGGP